jgi:hypothetical protein
VPDDFLEMFYLLPLNCCLLPLNFHSLNELLKHLNAVPLLNISLLSFWEAQLRKSCRLIEQGVAIYVVFFILDVDLLHPMNNCRGTTIADWWTGFLELLSFSLLFVKEFAEFSLKLPPVDQIHHDHQSSQSC